jgi:uncharacterized protein
MTPKSYKRRDAAEVPTSSERRIDRGSVPLAAPYRRKDGTLLCEGIVSAPGVLTYRDAAGAEWRELVPESTLADPEYLAAVAQATITLEHPEEDVTPDNVQTHSVGNTDGTVELLEGGYVKARIAVRARKALDAVDAGIVELSPGYDVFLDKTPGVDPVHGAYDAIQIKRIPNHIAIVPTGRSGPDVRLRADTAAQVLPTKKEDSMTPEQLKALMDAMAQGNRDLLAGILAGFKDVMKGGGKPDPASPAPESMDASEMEKKMDAAITAGAATRAALLVQAERHKVEVKDGVTTADLRRAIATKLKPELRKDASDDYCQALIDQAEEAAKVEVEDPYASFSTPKPGTTGARHDGDDRPVRAIDNLRKSNGWKV